MTGSMQVGHDAGYYTKGGGGADEYYTGAGTKGSGLEEPVGRWFSPDGGKNSLGLKGNISSEVMKRVYTEGLDPRDPKFWSDDPQVRLECARLGKGPRSFRTAEELLDERVAQEGGEVLPERLEQLKREVREQARTNVAFMDATYSPPKSASVAWAAYARSASEARAAGDEQAAQRFDALRADVEEACYEAHREYVNHLFDRAGYARTGRHGKGQAGSWVRSEGWTVGQFLQYTSRENDPQLHVHGPILNKQVCPDGQVRSLDTALIRDNRAGASAVADATFAQSLTRRHAENGVGLEWRLRPDGVAREIVGVDQASMDLFSKRTKNMTPKLREKVARFEDTFGRAPNPLELARLSKEASLHTRKSKGAVKSAETLDDQMREWDRELRDEVMRGMTATGRRLSGRGVDERVAGDTFSPDSVITRALDSAQAKRSSFSRSELEREIAAALPDNLGVDLGEGAVRTIISRLADRAMQHSSVVQVSGKEMTGDALPADLRHQDNTSVYVRPGSERYATQGAIVAEQALRRSAVTRGRAAVPVAQVRDWLDANEGNTGKLHPDQRAAVEGILAGGAAVKTLIGPAGTGKTFTVGAVNQAWGPLIGGRVIGVALSENATNVMRGEGLTAKNIAQFLDAQDRLERDGQVQDVSHGAPRTYRASDEDRQWQLGPKDLLVVDEAAMVDSATVSRLHQICERAGASMCATGDPKQTGAVGAGGAMGLIAAEQGADVYTLAEVQRFNSPWEGPASLRMREGHLDGVAEYDRRGRVHDCGTRAQAEAAAVKSYVAEHLEGRVPAIICKSNEQAASVSAQVRAELIRAGRVEQDGVALRDGTEAGVGDFVAARQNDYQVGVTNRRTYTVREVREDGSIRVEATDGSGERVMPAGYVSDHVTLGYAGTVTAVQGRTLTGGAKNLVDPSWSQEDVYVGGTRSKSRNDFYVTTKPEIAEQPTGASHETPEVTGVGVIEEIMRRGASAEDAAVAQAEAEAELHAHSQTIHARHEEAVNVVSRSRTALWLDELAAEGHLTDDERSRFAADEQGTGQIGKLLRTVEQSGHDPRQALRDAVVDRTLDGLRSVAHGVHARISTTYADALNPRVEHVSDAPPATENAAHKRYVEKLAEMADDRRRELGTQVAEEQPQWAVEALGPVPDDVVARAEWEHKAGVVAAYREAHPSEHESDEVALGRAPGTSTPEARASWHAAWSALGRPEAGREESELSDGALRNRVAAWEKEQGWAPKNVWEEMKAAGQQVQEAENDAVLRRAEAARAEDPAERQRLEEIAAQREAQAEVMRDTAERLERAAQARADWHAETAVTRAMAMRAEAELDSRGIPAGAEEDRVTAAEWLEAEELSRREDDEHRVITETDRPDEVWDEDAGDLVQIVDEVLEADDANLPVPYVEQDIVDAEVIEPDEEAQEEVVEEVEAYDGPEMPKGVPNTVEVDAMMAEADLVDAELADRRSMEAAASPQEPAGYEWVEQEPAVDDVQQDEADLVDAG